MKQIKLIGGLMLLAVAAAPLSAFGHCQVPCGIYDDAARVARLYEDATTIEKGMTMIAELAGKNDAQSANQLTRWIMNKEQHASFIITTIAEYFLAQRIKPVAPGAEEHGDYLQKLAAHHRVIVAAMKAKQNTDLKYVQDLRAAIDGIAPYYAPQHDH